MEENERNRLTRECATFMESYGVTMREVDRFVDTLPSNRLLDAFPEEEEFEENFVGVPETPLPEPLEDQAEE